MVGAPQDGVLLLVHASIAEPVVFDFVMRRPEPVVLRYHNITPAAYFEPYDPGFAALLAGGRHELAALRDRTVLALADSRWNEAELLSLGYERTAVVPLLCDLAPLLGAAAPQSSRLHLPPPGDGPLLLFVGRVAPNKGHAWCLEALHVLQTYHQPRAQMIFAGGGEVPAYRAALRRAAAELGLRSTFTGKVSVEELAALYRRADVFLCMSEHEGFCAPLVEAMAFSLPVVAWGTTAIPDTVGDAAVVLPDRDPLLAAGAVLRVLDDATLRGSLIERGRARVAGEFAAVTVQRRLAEHVLRAA